jgi:hypothetical protein
MYMGEPQENKYIKYLKAQLNLPKIKKTFDPPDDWDGNKLPNAR